LSAKNLYFARTIVTVHTSTHQYGLADGGDGLARGRGRKLDGQIGQTEDGHQLWQTILPHKLPTVVVRRVVTQYCLHKLHLQNDVNAMLIKTVQSLFSKLIFTYNGHYSRAVKTIKSLWTTNLKSTTTDHIENVVHERNGLLVLR